MNLKLHDALRRGNDADRWAAANTRLTALAGTRVVTHFRIPLYRNGYALLVSSATTSALGLFYWILAARRYSADTVGLGSATLSAMMLLSGISQLGLNSALVRFVPLVAGLPRRTGGQDLT